MIKSITSEQKQQLYVFADKWREEVSNPIDLTQAKKLLTELYPQRKILYTKSLFEIISLLKGKNFPAKFSSELYSELYRELNSELHSELDRELDSELYSELYSELDRELYSELDRELHSELYRELYSELYSELDRELHSELDRELHSELHRELYRELHSETKTKWTKFTAYYLYKWAAYYQLCKFLGVNLSESKLRRFTELLKYCPLTIYINNLVIVVEKPSISFEEKVLHSESKAAIRWADGSGMYYLRGVRLTQKLWQSILLNEMTFDEILAIENADQQAVALEYNGNAVINSGADLIHRSDRNNELFYIKNKKINQILDEPELYFLRMQCPTGRTFVECIEPSFARIALNADACQAHNLGLEISEYELLRREA